MSNLACVPLDYAWFAFLLCATVGTIGLAPGLLLRGDPRRERQLWRALWLQSLVLMIGGWVGIYWRAVPDCFAPTVAADETPLTRVLALAWLTLVAAFLLSDLLRLAWIYFGLRSARPHRVAIGTDFVHVILTAGKSSPYVLGLFRPQVIVPRQLLQLLAPADLQAVIAHELAHIHARDLLWAWPEWILRRVLFYHPLMWWASYRHSEAKEICADWQAMSWLGLSPRQYGQSLLALLQCADGAVAAPLTARAVSGLRRLQRRLGWIEAGPRPLSLWSRGLGAAAVVASFVAGLAQARTTGPAMRAGMCVQRQHELLLESVLNLRADPKTCEQGENEK